MQQNSSYKLLSGVILGVALASHTSFADNVDLTGSNRDVASITGDNNVVGGQGNSITTDTNSPDGNSVTGRDNTIVSGDFNDVSGRGNTVEQIGREGGHFTNHNVVGGLNNTVNNSSNNIVSGLNQVVEDSSVGNSVAGKNNRTTNSSSLNDVSGEFNTLENRAKHNSVTGLTNTLDGGDAANDAVDGSSRNSVAGSFNQLTDSDNNDVSGSHNTLIGVNDGSVVDEEDPNYIDLKADGAGHNIISGNNNTIENSDFNVVSGRGNTIGADITNADATYNGSAFNTVSGSGHTVGSAGTTSSFNTISGENHTVMGNSNIVTGSGSTVTANNAVALGGNNTVTSDGNVALGFGSSATMTNAETVAADGGFTIENVTHTEVNTATGGQADLGNRLVTGVADGRVTNTSSDAINGAQLHSVASQIGAEVNNNTTNIVNNTRNIQNNTRNITVNRRNIAVNRRDISVNRQNIAINAQGIERNTQSINRVDADLQGFKQEASAGIAGASSFVDPVSGIIGTSVAIGFANYNSEQAVSANFGYTPEEAPNLDLFAGIAVNSSGSDIYRAGARYHWGGAKNADDTTGLVDKVKIAKLEKSVSLYRSQVEILTAQNQEIMENMKKLNQLVTANGQAAEKVTEAVASN